MTRQRILVLTASIGAGHDGPAKELARRLQFRGAHVMLVDLVDVAPFGQSLRRAFRGVLTRNPRRWGRICASFEKSPRLPVAARVLIALAGRRVAQVIDEDSIDLVVSTYLFGGRVMGAAREYLDRPVPVVTYVTDPAVHPLWIDDVTDLYLATWTFTMPLLRGLTATPAALVAPATREPFNSRLGDVRTGWQPSGDKPWALVVSGPWGVGDVVGAARDVLADGRFRPVVGCGNNAGLLAEVDAIPGVIALGWVRDMAALMRDYSVAVLNSGGLTLAEAASIGLPVVHHKPLPGQGEMNAAACRAGAGAPVSNDVLQLRAALDAALDNAASLTTRLGDVDPAAAILLGLGRDAVAEGR